jgi:hypothetical protein
MTLMPTAKAKKRSIITEAKRRRHLARNGISRDDDSVYGALMRVGHDEDFEPSRMPEPTDAPIGSLERLLVITRRVVRGEFIRHPDDNSMVATHEQQEEARDFAREEARKYRGR